MDLLLDLVNRHKVRIEDVEIYALITQYLDYVENMTEENLEGRASFLEMAARLVYIKTTALLPREPESFDPAEELRQELIDFQDVKCLAQMLQERTEDHDYIVRTPQVFPADMVYKNTHPAQLLPQAWGLALGNGKRRLPPDPARFEGIVRTVFVALRDKFDQIFALLSQKETQSLRAFFLQQPSRSDLTATFLALLVLVKSKRIHVYGAGKDAVLRRQNDAAQWLDIDDF
jgi:segregation and condensation protein A